MKNRFWKVLAVVLGVAALTIVPAGCDLFGSDGESAGTLTVSVSGFDRECGSEEETPVFIAWVLPGGTYVSPDMESDTDPVAFVVFELVDASRTADVALKLDDSSETPPVWRGSGGKRYDVYPTIFCIDFGGIFDPGETGPAWIYKAADFSQPVSYTQDGNKTIDTFFTDYLEGAGAPGESEPM